MKYLVLFVVLAVAFGIWSGKRRAEAQVRQQRKARPPQLQAMVACERCGMHLPQSEAGSDGQGHWYCPEHTPTSHS